MSWTIHTELNGMFTYNAPSEDECKIRQLLAPGGWATVWQGGRKVHLRTDYIVTVTKDDQNVAF